MEIIKVAQVVPIEWPILSNSEEASNLNYFRIKTHFFGGLKFFVFMYHIHLRSTFLYILTILDSTERLTKNFRRIFVQGN
jgi:hypothetical protein